MICTHLRELYQLCEDNQLRISSSDLVQVVCKQCDRTETCPSMLMDQYDAIDQDDQVSKTQDSVKDQE